MSIPVGNPITPQTLKDLGAIDYFAPAPGFDPAGSWTMEYDIWTCHGYIDRDNLLKGSMTMQRIAGATSSDPYTLIITEEVKDNDNVENTVNAQVVCAADGTLQSWTLSSIFTLNGNPLTPSCDITESVTVNGDKLDVVRDGISFQRDCVVNPLADWGVFEIVQKLSFAMPGEMTFDELEGLSLLKKNQKLKYRGPGSIELVGGTKNMHCFQQIGEGILPYEYWLDEDHQLLMAITFCGAYILKSTLPTDNTAPTPDPMTWAIAPAVSGGFALDMTASTATDNLYGVEYYFNNITNPTHDSGWQSSPYYRDKNLTPEQEYSYRVKARDTSSNNNETGWSGTFSAIPEASGEPPLVETIFENFETDPTTRGWVNGQTGNTTFTYNPGGWLDAVICRDELNRSLYYTTLGGLYTKDKEFWLEMDMEIVSSVDVLQQALFGVFNLNNTDNHHNCIVDRFSYDNYKGAPRGNRNDLYGYDSAGTGLDLVSSPDSPGIPYGAAVRVKIHYQNGSGNLGVYNINSNGSTGSLIMSSSGTIIGSTNTLEVDIFALGNRTDGALRESITFKFDNLYFSSVGSNPSPQLPSFYVEENPE